MVEAGSPLNEAEMTVQPQSYVKLGQNPQGRIGLASFQDNPMPR